MKYFISIFTSIFFAFIIMQAFKAVADENPHVAHYTSTNTVLSSMTPDQAVKRLQDGNLRFVKNKPITRNLLQQAKVTSAKGQFPFAVILSCMDSRGSPELIFDQGLGDVFSVRVAGNIIDADQLGGMEFATQVVGSKVIVVMGHTQCGAVKGACNGVELGNLTQLLQKIEPAVKTVKDKANGGVDCNDNAVVDAIAKQNVLDMMKQITTDSSVIHDLVENNKVMIVGAMHYLASGKVVFFDENGKEF